MAFSCDLCGKSVNLVQDMHGWYFVEIRKYSIEGNIVRSDPVATQGYCSNCASNWLQLINLLPSGKKEAK